MLSETQTNNTGITLGELISLLEDAGITAELRDAQGNTTNDAKAHDLRIFGAACDSRVVRDGDIFFCKGKAFKPDYLSLALEAGASCYLCAKENEAIIANAAKDSPGIVVSDLRSAMSIAAANAFGHPDRTIDVLGVTGTKGKSTTTYMLRAIFDGEEEGSVASIIGSIDTYDGVESFESHNTTPEAPDLWRHLANAAVSGKNPMIMEVSSHGLKYQRTDELSLKVGAFLNIGRDHISSAEHTDYNDYFASKLLIFDHTQNAVVNLDSDESEVILARAQERCENVLTFSATNHAADVWAEDIRSELGSISFVCHTPSWTRELTVSMAGLFNVDNALCAVAMCEFLHIDPERIAYGLSHSSVPGRMEIIQTSEPKVLGLVDYAHNALSFRRFFESVDKEFPGRKVISVFGAAGDKAQERRIELPQEAAKWSDLIIYTEEDPAHEPAEKICQEMADNTPAYQAYEIHVDRNEAIERAVEYALSLEDESIVVMLAKGDETRQHRGDSFEPVMPDGEIFLAAMQAQAGAYELATGHGEG